MTIRTPIAMGEFYHIYNRGTDKREVFLDNKDHERFMALLYLANGSENIHISNHQGRTLMDLLACEKGELLVDIGAWCLMQNHFHLLVRQRVEDGITRFMQKLSTAYTMYFNKRYERTGALFEGKFKSKHIWEDRYLKYLIAYIHLNPASSPSRSNLDGYAYSSYPEYAGALRPQGKIINKYSLPLYFEAPAEFVKEMEDWLSYREETIKVEP